MVYLLYGTIDYLIKKELNSILEKTKINDLSISKYDLNEDSIHVIIDDANTISLFEEKKIIIASNSFIFTAANKKNSQDITVLEAYLNNIFNDTILIFTLNNEKLDERKKIVKLIRKNGIVKEFNNANVLNIVANLFAGYEVSSPTIKLLIDRVGDNINLLSNYVEQIKLYKYPETNISDEDIVNLTNKTIEENNFKLIDAIINQNKLKAIALYNDRLILNEEPIAIIISLANQIRIMYQSKGLLSLGHTENNIAAILGIHPYRVKLAIANAHKFESNKLLKCLDALADIDYNIKTGSIDKVLALEIFILNM